MKKKQMIKFNKSFKSHINIKKIWKFLAVRGFSILMKLKLKLIKPSSRVIKGSLVASRYSLPLSTPLRVIETIRAIYPRYKLPNKLVF